MNEPTRRTTIIRLVVTITWLFFAILLLELPSDIPIIDTLSSVFGRNDTGYALGHVVLFGTTTVMIRWVLEAFLPPCTASVWGVGIAMMLGVVTELLQFNTRNRGVTLLDLSANLVGVMIAGMWFAYDSRKSKR